MQFSIDLRKKYVLILCGLAILLAGIITGYAYGTANPPVFGHSAGEVEIDIDGSVTNLQNAIDNNLINPSKRFNDITFAELQNYHDDFKCNAADMFATSACNRYCGSGCSAGMPDCKGAFQGKGYIGGIMIEIDCASQKAVCLCVN